MDTLANPKGSLRDGSFRITCVTLKEVSRRVLKSNVKRVETQSSYGSFFNGHSNTKKGVIHIIARGYMTPGAELR